MNGEGLGMQDTALRLFRGLAGSYDRTVDLATLFQDRSWKKWAAERMPSGEGALLLDLGCGTLLMERVMSGLRCMFVGLDLTREMLREGQSKDLRNVSLLVNGDGEELPFRARAFDGVVSGYVAKYVDAAQFAEELARVTKPGGTVVLYDFARPRGAWALPLQAYVQGGLRVASFLLGLAGRGSAYAFYRLPDIIESTVWDRQIQREMEDHGFVTAATARLTGGMVFAYEGIRS